MLTPLLIKILTLAFDSRTNEQEAVAAFLKARSRVPNFATLKGGVVEKIVYVDKIQYKDRIIYKDRTEYKVEYRDRIIQKGANLDGVTSHPTMQYKIKVNASSFVALHQFLTNFHYEPYYRLIFKEDKSFFSNKYICVIRVFLEDNYLQIFNREFKKFEREHG